MIINFAKKNFLKFVIFSIVGGTSALVGIIAFNIFFELGFKFIISQMLAMPLAVTYNFLMNRTITFSARRFLLRKQILRWIVVYGISIGVNFLTSVFVVRLLGENTLNANIAVICGIIVSIPVSFLGSLLWAFKKRPEEIIVS